MEGYITRWHMLLLHLGVKLTNGKILMYHVNILGY